MNNLINGANSYKRGNEQIKFQNLKAKSRRATQQMAATGGDKQTATEVFPLKKLLNNRILSSLPDDDFARLLPDLEPISLTGGDNLHKPEEPFDFVYFPEDAVISHLHVLTSGSASEVAVVGKESAVGLSGLFSRKPPNYWTEILIGGTALRIKTGSLRAEFKRGGVLQNLLLEAADELFVQTAQRAVCNSHHIVEQRFVNWLLNVHDRAILNRLPLTQDQIARHLGVHRPGVTLAALSLRQKGLVDYCRGNLNILDRQGLEQLSCECYSMLKESLLAA